MQTNNPDTVPAVYKKSSFIDTWFVVENVEIDIANIELKKANHQNNSEKVDIIQKYITHMLLLIFCTWPVP